MSPRTKIEEQDLTLYTGVPLRSLEEITASAASHDYALAQRAQSHLATTFNIFASEMERRVNNVEASVAQLSSQLHSGESLNAAFRGAVLALPSLPSLPHQSRHQYAHPLHNQPHPVSSESTSAPTVRPQVPYLGSDSPIEALVVPDSSASEAHLPRFETSGMETKWYTKRPMPDFEVKLVRPDGRLYTDTAGWHLTVRLVTGHGIYDDTGSLLRGPGGSAEDSALVFPIVAGRAVLSGLRFQAVSSKNGKTFSLEFSSRGHKTAASKSVPIVVLSERLKNERKAADMCDLRPNDDIARVPSLGKAYCQRLNSLGFRTVADLATIPVSPADRQVRLELLNKLRKDRGALTEAKLMTLVREAHKVVQAEEHRQREAEKSEVEQDEETDEEMDDEEPEEDPIDTTSTESSSPTTTSKPQNFNSSPRTASMDSESEADLTARKLSCPLWGQGILPEEPETSRMSKPELEIDDMLNIDRMDRGYAY